MLYPKWVTAKRQLYLVKLFLDGGLRCQQGHINCPIVEHYLHTEYKLSSVTQAENRPCYKADGEPLKDKYGNQLYITVYKSIPDLQTKHSLKTMYESKSDTAIKNWIVDDRERKQLDWLAERKAIHALNEKPYHNGRFGSVSSVIWHESQPIYYLECIGMNGLTLQPFAKVKMAGSYFHLYVDLGDILRKVSKNRKRKAIRYNKPLGDSIQSQVNDLIMNSVQHYLNH
jgi:hypothetical protein